MVKNTYSFKKTLKKFGIDVAIVLITGLISIWQSDARYIALIPFLKAGLDYIKHRKG